MAFSAENSLLLAPMKSDAAISRPGENGVPRGLKWNAHRAEVNLDVQLALDKSFSLIE